MLKKFISENLLEWAITKCGGYESVLLLLHQLLNLKLMIELNSVKKKVELDFY